MQPFAYSRVSSAQDAIQAQAAAASSPNSPGVHAAGQYLAGGTTLIDLMKLDVMRPQVVTDINALEQTPSGQIQSGPQGLRLGALVRMSAAADHPDVRSNYPVIAQS